MLTIQNMIVHLKALLENCQEQLFFQESLIENQLIIDEEHLAADYNDDLSIADQDYSRCKEFLNARLVGPVMCEKCCGFEKDLFDDIAKICGNSVETHEHRGNGHPIVRKYRLNT